jgi:glycosyltransferase involved in cell wall biosynthesis
MTLEQCWHEVPGGTARAALELATALKARDHVELVGIAARHSAAPDPAFEPSIPMKFARVPRLAMYEGWHRLRHPRIESISGPIDLVHATGIAFPPSAAPVVATLHDLAFLRMPDYYTARGNSFFRTALALTRKYAAIVCCSSLQTLHDCVDAGIREDRLRHVPLGVRPATPTEAERRAVRSRYGLERPFILWTGTREPRKNLARLIDAYRTLSDLDVDLALVGPKGWHQDQTGLDAALPSGVHTLGFVSASELTALYAECAVFCFPSIFEGFGLPVVEAMAQSAPVISSRGTSTEELVADAGVLVDPLDTEEIANALRGVLTDPERRAALGTAGRIRAQQYTWDATAAATEAIYQELLG